MTRHSTLLVSLGLAVCCALASCGEKAGGDSGGEGGLDASSGSSSGSSGGSTSGGSGGSSGGSSGASSSSGSSGSTSGGSSGSSGSSSGAPLSPLCPQTLDQAMGPCTPPTRGLLDCEYGGNAFGQCATLASCAQPTLGVWSWVVTQPAPGCGQNAPQCPAAFGMSEGQACPLQSNCQYSEGACGCVPCFGDAGNSGYWHCRAWSDVGPSPNCPAPRPLLGTECNFPDGTQCDYSQCCRGPSLGISTTCVGGVWEDAPTGGCSCGIEHCP